MAEDTRDNLRRVMEGLLDPAAYPHPVEGPRLVQTHGSCVFLTGTIVYKVKKPVNFGFLDYSTLAKRERCCRREVMLNRRLCPEIYLDVVPIVEQDGRLRVGAEGPVAEWAVRMRQLPEADMLPARLEAGLVGEQAAARLARVLARFHEGAARGPEIRAFGAPEVVRTNVEENFTQTEALTGPALPRDQFEAVRGCSRRFLLDREALFRERVAEERIRDGHGDLRAQNICLSPGLQDGIQILDCIEFNDRFRYEDTAADLAYLAMDLDLAGHAALRFALVRAYVAASGDTGLEGVLPFYLCYRAYVRGKIALLASQECEMPAAERQRHLETAAAAFDLARSYAQPRPAPALLLTMGFSGSGKSMLARELARRLPAVHQASDRVRKELAGLPATARLPGAAYRPAPRAAVYAELRRRAEAHLREGLHVLLDATFLRREDRTAAASLAADCGAEFRVLECRCPDTEIRARLREREREGTDASDAGVAVYEGQLREAEPMTTDELGAGRWVEVDTSLPPAQAARVVLREFWWS